MYYYILLIIQITFLFTILGFAFYAIYAQFSGAPFLPSRKKHVRNMLGLADLKAGDRLIDVGSGDGRIVIMAAKEGVEATGIEINPFLVWWSRLKALFLPKRKVKIIRGNLWYTDLAQYDVVTLFFITDKMERMKNKIKSEMKPGSRVLSHHFSFPDWQPVEKRGTVYLYIV